MSAPAVKELIGRCAAVAGARTNGLSLLRWPHVPTVALNAARPAEAAAIYQALGLAPLPIRRKDKRPSDNDWKEQVAAGTYTPSLFPEGGNVALALGPQSRDLADVDIDSDDPNVPRLAREFLPPTVTFGREGRLSSHRLYRCAGAVTVDLPLEAGRGQAPKQHRRAARPGRNEPKLQHVEIRGAGLITVVPPGTHHTDQSIRFERETDRVSEISASALRTGVGKVVAGAVLARAWPERGARHEFRLAVAGALLGAGWSQDDVRDFLMAVGRLVDDDATDLVAAIRTSAEREVRTGWPTVAKLLQPYDTPLGITSGDQAAKLIRDALFPQQTAEASSRGASPSYVAREGVGMFHVKPIGNGAIEVPLSDFTARIVADIGRDDGAEVKRVLRVEARCSTMRHEFDVATDRFASMAWVLENLGTSGTILAGSTTKDHLRAAILQLSKEGAERRVEYTHTGWRGVNGEYVYLHGGGAVGRGGLVAGIAVSLPSQLEPFAFPPQTSAADLSAAVRAAWRLPHVFGNHPVPLLLQAAVFRAVLPMPCNFSVFVAGPTGAYKSQLAAIAQQHFGAGFTDKYLPGSWSSTANATEVLAFAAKDAVLVVDDFAPSGSTVEVNRYHQQAERLFRAQGNRSGRGRLSASADLRATKAPRGLIIATGEDVPRGQSIRARLLVLEMAPGAIASANLSEAQATASSGLYASALGGFIAWIAAHYDAVRTEAQQLTINYRTEATGAGSAHRRTPEIVAQLLVASEMFGRFAVSIGAVTDIEKRERAGAVRQALAVVGNEQAAHQAAAEPTVQFLDALRAALTMGDAHVANAGANGGAPQYHARALGWHSLSDESLVPNGKCIGWVAGNDALYLEPGASYAIAQEVARKSATSLGVTPRTLHRRLFERGLLLSTEAEARGTLAVRKMIQGRRIPVLHVPRSALIDGGEDGDLVATRVGMER